MTDSMKVGAPLDQLGLPPMELAESSNERNNSRFLYRCVYPTFQKLFILLFIVTFSAGTYILLLKLLESSDNSSRSTEIIIVTGLKDSPNITLYESDMHIIFKIGNVTSDARSRRKRNTLETHANLDHLNENEHEQVKEIVLQHHTLCREEVHKEICRELIKKLKSIIQHNEEAPATAAINLVDVAKRKEEQIAKMRGAFNKRLARRPMEMHPNLLPQPQFRVTPQITDTCLLAKLLKQSYPHVHGIYDPPTQEFSEPFMDQPHPRMRYFQPPTHSYMQSREIENTKQKTHPQDVEIFMSFLTPKPDTKKQQAANATTRDVPCPTGALPCDNSEDCIDEKQWCDGNVDCSDASDEVRCNCKSRVDESRLCDGYFDCPFGEDEMGCFGCSENKFSCKDINLQSQSTCYTKEQRCNNVVDCPNHKDEIECNMLAPSLLKNPLFAISNTEGYLHRNFKGNWYAVCENPYMWAHDACRRETGLMIRPPYIQVVPIDPLLKVSYLNTGPGGSIQSSDTCFNSSAIYVTCPDFLCGTRVSTTSQLLRENVENHLFGRNKRFLFPNLQGPYDPYNMYYGNRMKRDTTDLKIDATIEDIDSVETDERNKRAESRVVGGKPSQPADWPWMVAIYRNGMFHCGGVVLTQSWVISAAHCVAKFWDHYYEVQVGMLRRFSFSPQEQNHRVTHVIMNQHYNQIDMKDDLSLLRVSPEIQFSRWVRPICLPGPNTAGNGWLWGPPPETICTAVGWGATIEHGPDPDHMREVEVPVWEHCKHREDRAGREICAGLVEGGKDACQGDSGGPLLCRNPLNSQQWYLAGIVSHGDGCARKGEPGVYTRVSLFVKWIKYHTSSKHLPGVQPIQECPGFKCKSGITKCLPLTRKCDKIVDCLDAEDELNCDFTDMRSVNNIFSKVGNKTNENKSSEKRESVQNPLFITGKAVLPISEITTEQSVSKSLTTSNKDSTTTKNNHNNKVTGSTGNDQTPDFEHASTIEMSPSTSFEESESVSTEIVTADPTTIVDARGDSDSFAISFTPESLESRSSVLEETKQDLEVNRRTDVIESDEKTTTFPNEMFDTISQSSDIITKTQTIFNNENKVSLDNTIPKAENINKNDTKSEEFVVELLQNLENSTETNKDLTDDGTNIKNLVTTNSNADGISAKNLPDLESKNNAIDKIEDIVFTELQPANIRKKHRIPKEFECRRIFQVIPFNQRCDHKADCEDGTDELGCTCLDYLSTYDQNLICDGIFDCSDGQDEIDCYNCPDQHFLCKRSEICVPLRYVCDGKPQCPLGEDELNCFALTNGKEMFYDIDDKPRINIEGYLTKRDKDDWHVVCEDNISVDKQEESANHICRYLGFSSANRYSVKYINVKEEDLSTFKVDDKRSRRNSNEGKPIHFAYRNVIERNNTARNIVIKEPQLLKEECVPNVTKTCKSLYVYCDRSLYTNFDVSQNIIFNREVETQQDVTTHMWPWVAKVFVEGYYKCTGILVDSSWVLISNACLWDSLPTNNFTSVVLGSQRILNSIGSFEKVHKVDAKKDLYRSRVVLLHLKVPVEYSNNVKPMVVSSSNLHADQKTVCVAVGQDLKNNTISIFLNETTKDCNLSNRCFIRRGNENILCQGSLNTDRQWAGVISCHSEQGWYPAASFVDSRGECGIGNMIVATDIENLKQELRYYSGKPGQVESQDHAEIDHCEGVRCKRGRCVSLKEMCDGVTNCEDGNDETDESCQMKKDICEQDPYSKGCECSLGQMKCRNGKCISKELFRDGNDDCEDGTDEPMRTSCSDYLARVMPSRLCDGVLHCLDRSDEDPMYCKCFAKRTFNCNSKSGEVEHCVAPDMVCDGVRDCSNGNDERTCIGLSAPNGTPYGVGQVMVRSHGVWRLKCYPTQNHTKSELEAICRELGFLSGHAKEIKEMKNTVFNTPNNMVLEPFSEVILNNQTIIKMRNTDEPIAKVFFDEDVKSCFPVFIECI